MAAFPPARPSRTFPTPGSVRCAARASATSRPTRTRTPLAGAGTATAAWSTSSPHSGPFAVARAPTPRGRAGDPCLALTRPNVTCLPHRRTATTRPTGTSCSRWTGEHVWHPVRAHARPRTTPLLVGRRRGVRLRLADGPASWSTACPRGGRRSTATTTRRSTTRRASSWSAWPRDVRRAHPRARRAAGEPACRDRPGRARARLPRRLRVGVGRGRRQDVPAVPALAGPARQAAAADLARRLPRRHLAPMSVCDPVGGMHDAVSRACCPQQVFAERPPPASTPTRRGVRPSICAS